MEIQAQLLFDAHAQTAEGPFWHADRLHFIDVEGRTLFRYRLEAGVERMWDLGQAVGCVAPTDDQRFVLGLEHGLGFLEPESGRVAMICDPGADRPENRFNDGKCDPVGRFWAGTISKPRQPDAALFRLDAELHCQRMLTGVINSNGLAWSGDGRTLYYIDTGTRRVDAFDFDVAAGTLANRRPVIDLSGHAYRPDGMTIDRQGQLWVALYNGGMVLRVDPGSGAITDRVRLPVPLVTSCCFGGAGLDELFITTARGKPYDQPLPHAGGVFHARVGVAGVPIHVFRTAAHPQEPSPATV